MIASVAGSVVQVRAFGAAMQTNNGKFVIRAYGAEDTWFGAMERDSSGYRVAYHRLAPNDWQAMLISKRSGLIATNSVDGLWAELKSPRFTTPILYQWMGFVQDQLVERGLLQNLNAAGCSPALLTATTQDLDKIVSLGLERGRIKIERRAA